MSEAAEHPNAAPYTVEANSDVTTVRMTGIDAGWEQWFLLTSDVHWDNPHCDRALYKKHLEQAKERKAGVFCFGDFFCVMQGKYDPRANKEGLRAEHQVTNYFDALVDTATSYLQPYRDHIVMFSPGNHETAILKRQETDLMRRLCNSLGIACGGYAGYVRFLFSRNENGGRTNHNLFYHHGYGGGGPVTKGVIQTNRRAVWLPDAQTVVTGHIHESTSVVLPRLRLSSAGITYLDEQTHITLATYKQEFDLGGGWHLERGAPPKPLGGMWLRFYWNPQSRNYIGHEFIRAN